MQARFMAAVAAAAMLAVFAGIGWGQGGAQPKPLVNADIVKMAKAGLGDQTIVLAIQSKPSSFDTSPEELIRLKGQGVTQAVLNAMLTASKPAPAEPVSPPPPPPPAQQTEPDQGPVGYWVGFFSFCAKNQGIIFKPTIYANNVELARMACDTYFYVLAQRGTYKFCATKGKCVTAAIDPGGPYYFRVLPTTLSYSIGQIDASRAEEEIQHHGVGPLDLGRVLAPKLVTINVNNPPAALLSPQ